MDFEGKILNMYKPSEVGWIGTIIILALGIGLVVAAQYFAKKNEMV
jgi:hypothetical protein